MQESDGLNACLVFRVISAQTGSVACKGKPIGKEVVNLQWPEQPLGVLVQVPDLFRLAA